MRSVSSGVNVFIIVFQTVSNFGEEHDPLSNWIMHQTILNEFKGRVFFHKYNPVSMGGQINEKMKRQRGIEVARKFEATHFLHMDCDEFWENFTKAKQEYIDSGCDGSVAQMYTYFRHPNLRLKNPDNYLVPFIHELNPDTAWSKRYPEYVDRTRQVNCKKVHIISEKMHHYSWCRLNISRKIRNSSARENIKKSNLMIDYAHCTPGMYIKDYDQELIWVEDLFGISHLFGDVPNS